MNRAELVNAVMEQAKSGDIQSKAQVERIVNSVFDVIQDAVVKGEDVSLVGFGTFTSVKKAARTGRNPQTGKEVKIAAKVAPKFKAGKAFKDAVNK